jgi:hypothetical protein
MTRIRIASCSCGQLKATCTGEPARISVCHCLSCKQRSGSAFSWTATFAREQVETAGESWMFERRGEENRWSRNHACRECGIIVHYEIELRPDMISIPAGTFAEIDFPEPAVIVFDECRNPWVRIETKEKPAFE